MESREYRTVDKSEWGPGAWQDEPDKKQWQDPKTGLPCLIVRGPAGALCGYVGVGKDHFYYGKKYSDWDDEELLDKGPNVSVHGGLTYSDFCAEGDETSNICHVPGDGEEDHVWWFGFDCAHAFDVSPRINSKIKIYFKSENVYRDMAYVEAQVTSLAEQLYNLAGGPISVL